MRPLFLRLDKASPVQGEVARRAGGVGSPFDNPPVTAYAVPAPFSVTPQKYEPTATDFWLVERMRREARSSQGGLWIEFFPS